MLLEAFRSHKRWLMFIAMVLIIPSFVVTGIYSYNRMISDDGAIASVDDEPVLPQDFDHAKSKQLDTLRVRMGDQFRANMLDNQDARAFILESVLTERSVNAEIVKSNIQISEATAIEMIKTFPAFQENGKFSTTRYQNYLQSIGQSDEYFVYSIRGDIAKQLLLNGITRTSIAPKMLAERVNVMLTETRTAKLHSIDAVKYLDAVQVTPSEAKTYWQNHQKEFEIPDEIDVQYVVLTPELFKGNLPNEEEIKTFYEQNPNRFKTQETRRASHILVGMEQGDDAAKAKIEKILKEVKAKPADFAKLAKQYSIDPGSASQGGDLGYFSRGMMVPSFDKAVFEAKQGEIVGPVKSDFGYHIITVTGIKPAGVRTLKEARDEIVALFDEQQSQRKFAEEAENFTNTVYEQSDSLTPVIEKYKLKPVTVKNVKAVENQNTGHAHYLNSHVLEALFSDECLKEKRNSQAIEVASNTLVAARVVAHRPSHIEAFEKSKEGILSHLRHERALEKAAADGAKLLGELRQGKAQKPQFGADTTMTRSNPGEHSFDLVNAVLRVPTKQLPAYVGVKESDRYVIALVTKSEIKKADDARLKQAQQEIAKYLARAEESAYAAALRVKHKAKIKNKDYLYETKKAAE